MSLAKEAAGLAAAALVQDGMVVGLGSGSTMQHVVWALGVRVREERLEVVGIPTSLETEAAARESGVTLGMLDGTKLDLAIDGADEVERGNLRLIKGLGGALLREKIVAEASARFVIVADDSKMVDTLGQRAPVPVEITTFGHVSVMARIAALGGKPVLRLRKDGAPFVTDGGNFVADCTGFAPVRDPYTLERQLRAIAGVVASGLFMLPVERVLVGHDDGSVTEMLSQ